MDVLEATPDSPSFWEERILIVRRHFEKKGYRVHSGLQFGCELVLYADIPQRVHSDFCVHVVPPGEC
jgi:tRNA splicing endonuclease